MAGQRFYLFHGWVLPHNNLVQRVTVGGHKLGSILAEQQVANLAASVQVVDRTQSLCVPESNAPVSSASSRRQYSSLMRIPTDCFDCCLMVWELSERLCVSCIPDEQLIVVATWSHLTQVKTPLEPTYLLLMTVQLWNVVIRASYVSHQYGPVSRTWAHQEVIPSTDAHSWQMTGHGPDHAVLSHIPYLYLAWIGTNTKIVIILTPVDRSYKVRLRQFAQSPNVGGACAPNINRATKANG